MDIFSTESDQTSSEQEKLILGLNNVHREFLDLYSNGLTFTEIGSLMGLSEISVEAIASSVLRCIQAPNLVVAEKLYSKHRRESRTVPKHKNVSKRLH